VDFGERTTWGLAIAGRTEVHQLFVLYCAAVRADVFQFYFCSSYQILVINFTFVRGLTIIYSLPSPSPTVGGN